jgi:sterol desaturase/sphingolipid hydroxylase (fatty acid hydroxylase superfamily)
VGVGYLLVGNVRDAAISALSVCAIVWGLERLFPTSKIPLETQRRSLQFWLITAIATGVASTLLQLLHQAHSPEPLFILHLDRWLASPRVHWSIYVVQPLLGIILYDFFDYWMHRAQHKWLWRQHSIHHAIEHLSGVNSYFHWTEPFLRTASITLPAAYIVGIDHAPSLIVIELLVRIQGNYLHSPTRLHLGPILRRVIADNRFHRIHHSRDPRHFDMNFGAGTSLWDQLFGTAYFPAPNEWPDTGMVELPEVATLSQYLWRPFVSPKTDISASGKTRVEA